MLFRVHAAVAVCVMAVTIIVSAEPIVGFGGYLDSDVWTDFEGNFY
ncbi:MAG: hypothetical protein GF344_03930, partial [Chitinivibrionales bacterium]|nr:hypothetical protein [Chitinivibrionales bacterium]MBD3356205.1 hypothetical protein [Chitinivibrionales bacterium]